ncbi:Uncharacterised protein [Mycobacterium tuberculosis]|nr:Uncharacterised protein [Mycobacterium tuberculosis]CNV69279.1 Uncharacterised protein [Mycobacterium tuberculosis]COY25864.1 Uncharacterised protein [Mycobacterium tuberculosis]
MGEDDGPQSKQHLLTGVSGDHGTPPLHDPPNDHGGGAGERCPPKRREHMAANPDVNTVADEQGRQQTRAGLHGHQQQAQRKRAAELTQQAA